MFVTRAAALATLLAACGPSPPTGPPIGPPSAACGDSAVSGSPIDYGAREAGANAIVRTIADPAASQVLASSGVILDPRPESFAIVSANNVDWVIGRDEVGAMYGALELAERVRLDGGAALPITGAPAVAVRGANLFLTLPADGESDWWFCDTDYWTQYLDLLAHARINFLDLHGMYNIGNTQFPNALPYFADSQSYPEVGAPKDARDRLAGMLRTIVAMAGARGIRVGLMTYRADLSLDGVTDASVSDGELRAYTREAAADLARRVPGLARIGFRIGESGHDAAWFNSTLVSGVRDASDSIGIYTRTWGTTKSDVLSVAAAGGANTIVEAKYNGEQLAAPYPIAGGQFAEWHNYSYEDYLNPPEPYTFIFQVRSGGTHRIFRHASFARARRAVETFTLSGARGFTLEAAHAYFPQRDDYHLADADRFSLWTFRRDELQYLLYGRLSYDPSTDERVFRAPLAARTGTDALWPSVQAASEVVPWIQLATTCGPDQRDYAPELEWGGTVGDWASPPGAAVSFACRRHGPFDTFAIASPDEAAADLAAGKPTARVSPLDVAAAIDSAVVTARAAQSVAIDPTNPEARDVVRECVALADLGDYQRHKLRAATALAVYRRSGAADWLAAARAEASSADDGWRALAADTGYLAPLHDAMRMCQFTRYCDDPGAYHWKTPLHWRVEADNLPSDAASIDSVEQVVRASPPAFSGALPDATAWLASPRPVSPSLASLTVDPADPRAPSWAVAVDFDSPLPGGANVTVLWKPFSGFADWQSVAATGAGAHWQATVAGGGAGALFAVEAAAPTLARRLPDPRAATPWLSLPPD